MGDSSDFALLKGKPEPKVTGLKCQYPVEFRERDLEGKPIVYHKKCGKPAALREIAGTLTSAQAILCDQHAAQADYQAAISANGYPLGKIDINARAAGHRQERLPGTGLLGPRGGYR